MKRKYAKVINMYDHMAKTISFPTPNTTTTTTLTNIPYFPLTTSSQSFDVVLPPYPNTVCDYNKTNYYDIRYQYNEFQCYSTTEGRIKKGKLELIFSIIEKSTLDYLHLLKHLNINRLLFNTILLEFAIKFRTKQYMELVATRQNFSEQDLFETIKIFL